VSLLAKIVPRGLRKLTWKKVGKVAKVAVPLAAAVAIPGLGGVLVKGVTAIGGVARKGASTVGNIAKAAGSTAEELASSAIDTFKSVEDARRQVEDAANAVDRATHHQPTAGQNAASFIEQHGTVLALAAVGVVLLFVLVRRK
jgi:hypothetical protein